MASTGPRHRFRTTIAAGGVAALLVAASSCSASERAASATMQSGNRPTATTELPPSTDPAPDPTAPTTSSPPSEPSGDSAAFCDSLRRFVETNGADDGVDALLGWFDEWRELGPQELHDELDVLTKMVEALDGLDGQDPSSLGRLLEALIDPAVVESIDTLATYAADECAVDLEGGGLGNLDDVFGGAPEG